MTRWTGRCRGTEKAGSAGEKTTSFAYLGLSDQVVAEQVGGRTTKTYQYALGRRVSQTAIAADGAKTEGFFGYNPHTDVETITGASGDTRSTYGYTAYGADDTAQFTGADKPGTAPGDGEPASAFRFNGMRLDAGSGEYDMGFREYAPGLNRFLTRDSYDGALSDLGLAADPYTGNRYAFASGNPISRIELDGHCAVYQWMCDVGGGIVDTATAPVTGLISTITGAGAAIACPSTAGPAYAGTACNGVQDSVTTSVQNQYNDLLDLGGAHGSAGWRAGQVIGAVGIPGATATRATTAAAAAAARAAARRAAEATARRTATQAADRVATNSVSRSLDDVVSLRGATTAEVEGLIPLGWIKSATNATKGGLGIRYSNPERLGEQIRIMPGKVTDPNPLKQGPYMRISRNGTVTDPILLFGNPTL